MASEYYFKTSHVIVYHNGTVHKKDHYIFQNISCYCLSKRHGKITAKLLDFKTSHVIVYPSHFRVF